MTTAAHTAGPWKVEVFTTAILIESGAGCICEMPSDHGQDPKGRIANARLIAAAPEMFEALENALVALRREYDDASDCIKDAVAALAKAKGGAA